MADVTDRPGPKERAADAKAAVEQSRHVASISQAERARLARHVKQIARGKTIAEVFAGR